MNENNTPVTTVINTDVQNVTNLAKTAVDHALNLLKLVPTPIPKASMLYKSLEEIRMVPLEANNNAANGIQVDFINQNPVTIIEGANTCDDYEMIHITSHEQTSKKDYSILNLVKPKNYKPKPQEKITVFGSKEDVMKLLKITAKCMEEHKYDKAKRMAEKAERIHPTPAARALLQQIRSMTIKAREEAAELAKVKSLNAAELANKCLRAIKEANELAIERSLKRFAELAKERALKAAELAKERALKAAELAKGVKSELTTNEENAQNIITNTVRYQTRSATKKAEKRVAVPMEDSEVCEATFRFTVANFRDLKDGVQSPPCYIRGLPWQIMVMPRQGPNGKKYLGLYLECNKDSTSPSWSCSAKAELRLISHRHKPRQQPFCRDIQHLFYREENDWGFSCFMPWDDVLDPAKGCIEDNAVTVEVHVMAEPPLGVPQGANKRGRMESTSDNSNNKWKTPLEMDKYK